MSTTTVSQISQKHKKEKDKERTSSQPQANERLKTVVRRLPPNLPEEVFWQSVQPWVTEETSVWKVFYPGKLRKKYAHSILNCIQEA
jgi:regulator of nonsense transcripts 3